MNFNNLSLILFSLFCITLSAEIHKTHLAESNPPIVGFAEAQGLRPTMEDAHRIEINKNYAFFGLFDGHGGRTVADIVAKNLHTNVMLEFEKTNYSDMHEALKESFIKTHRELDYKIARNQGCTAVAAVVKDKTLYVANAGDSRAILCSESIAIPLTMDHKPDRPDEKQRIENLGGKVITWGVPRVNGNLAISRAIGDKDLNPYVIPEPEITKHNLTSKDIFMIIACDGVWDVIDNQTAVNIVKQALTQNPDLNAAATQLTNEALKRGSTDNVSVMIVNLKKL
jgi:serine/threonine protein phosphatase PrpC